MLRVRGDAMVDADGARVVLRGAGVGGWMNMENFITGYPANETAMRAAVAGVIGAERADRFFDRLLDRFFDEADARLLAELGVNCLRLPINYRHFERDARPSSCSRRASSGWRARSTCARARHLQRDRPARGAGPPEPALALRQRDARRRVLAAPALPGPRRGPVARARRALPRSWVGGRLQPAQRAGRPDRRGRGAVPRPARGRRPRGRPRPHRLRRRQHVLDGLLDLRRAVRERRLRAARLRARRHVVRRPVSGETAGVWVDRDTLEETFLARTRFQRETGTPIWVGEFGPVYTGDPERDEQRYQVLCDQLDIYDRHGAGWSIWTYKDVGLHGLVEAARTAPTWSASAT